MVLLIVDLVLRGMSVTFGPTTMLWPVQEYPLGLQEFPCFPDWNNTHVVPIRPAHFERSVSSSTHAIEVSVADDVFEYITAGPDAVTTSPVSLQRIWLREIIPRPKKFYCASRSWAVAGGSLSHLRTQAAQEGYTYNKNVTSVVEPIAERLGGPRQIKARRILM